MLMPLELNKSIYGEATTASYKFLMITLSLSGQDVCDSHLACASAVATPDEIAAAVASA